MTGWIEKKYSLKTRAFPDLEEITEKLLISRGILTEEERQTFLFPNYEKDLLNPFLLGGMKKAIERIRRAFEKKETICIFGDYDADGVTASVLLKDVLDRLKIKNFYYIPDRNKEGYGLNFKALEYIKKKKADLVITVDSGISSAKEVEKSRELGLEVVITDHHHPPENLPKAWAVINPKKKGDPYPFKDLAGVGVAFKLAQAIFQEFTHLEKKELKWLLDLVALGTVADCVPLVGENRTLVKYGLIVLAKTRRVGLRHIFKVGKINNNGSFFDSEQVAFQLVPRINAAGRMDHANTACSLLSCSAENEANARFLALELEEQNKMRQKVTKQIMKEIEEKLSQKDLTNLIWESSCHWEMGVLGLVAGKIADKYNRPTFILQEKEGWLKGSGRSAGGFNLIQAIEKNGLLLEKYGGHSQAAGLVMNKKNEEEFLKKFRNLIDKSGIIDWNKKALVDCRIQPEEINEKLLREISFLKPFGEGNPAPLFFLEKGEIVDKKLLGKDRNHLKLWIKKPGGFLEAIGFGLGNKFSELKTGFVNLLFNLENDEWNGRKKIQLRLLDLEVSPNK